MIVYFLFAGAILFLIGGVVFIRGGWEKSDKNVKAVPISNLDEIQSLSKEESKEENPLVEQNQQLAEALKQEVASKQSSGVDGEGQKRLESMERELSKARQSIEELTTENHQFGKKWDVYVSKVNIFYDEVAIARNDLKKDLGDKEAEILSLEKQICGVQEEKDKLIYQHQPVEQLESEKRNLTAQLTEKESRIGSLNMEVSSLKEEYSQKIKAADEIIRTIKEKLISEERRAKLDGSEKKQEEGVVSSEEAEKFKMERAGLLKEKIIWEQDFSRIKEYNDHLLKKEKLLQNELTKNRAQAIGLEKICGDFKLQIEEMSQALEEKEVKL